jgi:hypothetical protein
MFLFEYNKKKFHFTAVYTESEAFSDIVTIMMLIFLSSSV